MTAKYRSLSVHLESLPMVPDKFYIALYRTQIQKHFMLGKDDGKLRQREFEYLVERIEQTSGIRLSLSTLKRLWRDEVTQLPHPSTLNALVSVLDYNSWSDFKLANAEVVPSPAVPSPEKKVSKSSSRVRWIGLVAAGSVAAFFLLQAFNRESSRKLVLPDNIPFAANKVVTMGVPNTVEFSYDVTGIEADSFFIQQSWDPRNKIAIDPRKHYFSSIYYLPGFHRAKLIVNDSVVSKSRIHIKTNGWFPVLEYRDRSHEPFYLDTVGSHRDGVLHATEKFITSAGIDVGKPFQLRYYNIRDFDSLRSDNFTLEAKIKMDKAKNIACPFSQVVIVAEENIFFLQMTASGCVGELGLQFGENFQRAKDTDLSAFGLDMYQWQSLRIACIDKSVAISLNGSTVHNLRFEKDFGKVVGIVFSFNSPAALDDVTLSNSNQDIIYSDSF